MGGPTPVGGSVSSKPEQMSVADLD
jgi:hypothetical protein